MTERQTGAEPLNGAIGTGAIRLVDDNKVRRLKQARLHRLHLIATLWTFNEQYKVRKAHNPQIRLASANRLNEEKIKAGRLNKERCCGGGVRERATTAARCNGANEATLTPWSLFNAHAIAEECTATLYRRRVNGRIATRRPAARASSASAPRRVLFPAPGGPVTPITTAF